MKNRLLILPPSLFLLLVLFAFNPTIGVAEQEEDPVVPWYEQWHRMAEKGLAEKHTGLHIYWTNGLNIETRQKNYTLRIGGKVLLDGGYISADDELQRAFPDLDGPEILFRKLSIAFSGTFYDWMAYKLEIDFADIKDIKDIWLRFAKVPLVDHFTLGYMKEPFSLEEWTGITSLSLMERALPTQAFAPGRNLGIRRHTAILDKRMTYALGLFWNVASFDDVGDLPDAYQDAKGVNLTGRITGLPWYEKGGEQLLHLGLSYTHMFRDKTNVDYAVRFDSRPETYLTDDKLVDTGQFLADYVDIINPEAAVLLGPLSFQGEYFHTFVNSYEDTQFWGYYLFASYFLTGEHRRYGNKSGTFFEAIPKHFFRPRKGQWGGWEVLLRHSYVDLNDGKIQGGRERNFSAGLNWYLGNRMQVKFNYVHAHVTDRLDPTVENGRADILQARLQFAF